MDIRQATKERIQELCHEKGITISKLSTLSAVPPTTLKSIIYNQSLNPGIVTIKKLCDGLDISIAEFFDTDVFKSLEQEIK